MSQQIAIRIPDDDLKAVDEAIAEGKFESRAAAVREGIRRLLRELRESNVARVYAQAYARHPEEPGVGEAGAALAAEVAAGEEPRA